MHVSVTLSGGAASQRREFSDQQGENVTARLRHAIASSPAVVFTQNYCPFSDEVRRILTELGCTAWVEFNLDEMHDERAAVHAELIRQTGQSAAPYVYVGGKLIGGCGPTKALKSEGLLPGMLVAAGAVLVKPSPGADAPSAMAGVSPAKCAAARVSDLCSTFMMYPEIVENRQVRIASFFVLVISLVVAICFKTNWAYWMMVWLMCETAIKFCGGGSMTTTGSAGVLLATIADKFGSRPRWKAAAPTQITVLFELTLMTLASFFFLASRLKLGLAMTCALIVVTLLEVVNFCPGTAIYRELLRLGYIDQDSSLQFLAALQEKNLAAAAAAGQKGSPAGSGGGAEYVSIHKQQLGAKTRSASEVHLLSALSPGGGTSSVASSSSGGSDNGEKQKGSGHGSVHAHETDPAAAFPAVELVPTAAASKPQVPTAAGQHAVSTARAPKFSVTESRVRAHTAYGCNLATDYTYKKQDRAGKGAFDPIKHVSILHWSMQLGICGLAGQWKGLAAMSSPPSVVATNVWQTITVLGLIWNSIETVLYALKCFKYPKRVRKEWQHPTIGNIFTFWPLVLVLYAPLIQPYSFTAAKAMFWIGTPLVCFFGLVKWATWMSNANTELNQVNPTWIVPPVATCIVAAVGMGISPSYKNGMQFFYAFAALAYFALLPSTFLKRIALPDEADGLRPAFGVWVAAPAVLSTGYVACFQSSGASADDFIFICLHFFAISHALVMVLGIFWRPFYARIPWNMSYWDAAFVTGAIAGSAGQYLAVKHGGLWPGVVYYGLMALTTSITLALVMQTTAALLNKGIFLPAGKWGPISFLHHAHDAIRAAGPKLIDAAHAAELAADDRDEGGRKASITVAAALNMQCTSYTVTVSEHLKQDFCVFYKYCNDLFPGVASVVDKRCAEEVHEELAAIQRKLAAGEVPSVRQLEGFCASVETLMAWEEESLGAVMRKHMSLNAQIALLRQIFDLTPSEAWRVKLPYMLNSLPQLSQRVMMMKALCWAMPERAQLMGAMIANGVDAVQWKRITDEMPQLIPRNMAKHMPYY